MTLAEILDEMYGFYLYDSGSFNMPFTVEDKERKNILYIKIYDIMKQDESKFGIDETKWYRERFLSDEAYKEGYRVTSIYMFYKWLYQLD